MRLLCDFIAMGRCFFSVVDNRTGVQSIYKPLPLVDESSAICRKKGQEFDQRKEEYRISIVFLNWKAALRELLCLDCASC